MNMKRRLVSIALATSMLMGLFSATAAAYSDVAGHWAESAIQRWESNALVDQWKDGAFLPGQGVTGTELAQVLEELFGCQSASPSSGVLTRQEAVAAIARQRGGRTPRP